MDNPQPNSKGSDTYECSSETRRRWVILKCNVALLHSYFTTLSWFSYRACLFRGRMQCLLRGSLLWVQGLQVYSLPSTSNIIKWWPIQVFLARLSAADSTTKWSELMHRGLWHKWETWPLLGSFFGRVALECITSLVGERRRRLLCI